MAIIKRNFGPIELDESESLTYIGSAGEITKNKVSGLLSIHDGVTEGGFELSDDNTLSIEEISLLTENVYRDTFPVVKKLNAVDPHPWWHNNLRLLEQSIFGVRLREDNFTSFHNNFKIPDDYIEGTPIDIEFTWIGTRDESGDVRLAFQWMIVDESTIDIMSGWSSTRGKVFTLTETDSELVQYTNFSTMGYEPIVDSRLKPGAILLSRIYRHSNSSSDTYSGDTYGLSLNLTYHSKRHL